jgi:hypothetical protein
MNVPLFLKRVLLLDAASCLAMGLMLLLGAGHLADLFAIDRSVLVLAGAILLPSALFIGWVASRVPIMPALVAIIIVVNIVWVAESFMLLGQTPGATAIGRAFVIAQALAVGGIALLETIGVLRLRSASAG